MKNLSFCIFIILFLVSCSNDDSNSKPLNPEVIITGYKIVSKTIATDGSNHEFENVVTGNLQNGKLFSTTTQNFTNGISQGTTVTTQDYFYDGNLLKSVIDNSGERKREFYYDAQNRMIAAKMTLGVSPSNYNYYRFVHFSNTILYFERISKPYNDPTAEIIYRNILEFDSNDNVIKAGRDTNFDGISENANQFTYSNNNLVSAQKSDGTILNFAYSNVIDTSAKLYEKSIGYKNSRIICSEEYVSASFSKFKQSNNLLSQEIIDNNYEILGNNYYKKKTQVSNLNNPEFTTTITTEYFFN